MQMVKVMVALEKVEKLKALKVNWDSYNADAPPLLNIRVAKVIEIGVSGFGVPEARNLKPGTTLPHLELHVQADVEGMFGEVAQTL